MVDPMTFWWIVLAGLALMFTAQYAISIRQEPSSNRKFASTRMMVSRGSGAVRGVIVHLQLYLVHTFRYIRNMTKISLTAFGIAAGGIVYILAGMVQFDPLAWLYFALTVVSSLQIFDYVSANPLTTAMGLAAVFVGVYLLNVGADIVRWGASAADDDDD